MTNPYTEAAAELATEQPSNPYAQTAADMVEAQRVAVRSSAMTAAASSPDAAASALRMSRQAGVPLDVVQRNEPQVRQQVTAQRIDTDTAAAPVLRNRYADPTFAAVAHDDSGPLATFEQRIGGVMRYLMGAEPSGGLPGAIVAGYHGAQSATAGAFRAISEFTAQPFDVLERFPAIGGNPLRRLSEGFGRIAQSENRKAEAASPPSGDFTRDAVSSGVQSLTQNVITLPMAMLPGGQVPALTAMAGQAGGQSYQKAREAGVSQNRALAYGLSDAAIEYATEKIPVGRLIGDLKGSASTVQTLLHQVKSEVPGEQIATVLQDLNEWAVMNPDRPFSDYLKERPSAAAATLIATLIGVGGNVAVMKTVQTAVDHAAAGAQQAQTAQAGAQQLGEAIKAADESKLKKRDPETFHELAAQLQPDAVVYVAPEHLATVDLTAVPAISEQVREGLLSGGDVAVPLADLFTHLPGEQLLPHIRLQPEAMTATEAQAFDGNAERDAQLARPAPLIEGAMLGAPEQANLDAPSWEVYQRTAAEAAQAAIEQRDSRQLRDLQWLANRKDEALREIQQLADTARAAIQAEVQTEVERMPVYAAQRFLATPEGKALPADVVAERFGFDSADTMHRAIAQAHPEATTVEGMTDQRMLEQHPDIADRIAQVRTAEALIADRTRTRFLATEAAALAQAVGNRVLLVQEARRYAEKAMATKALRDVRPAQYKAAAARAGRQAEEAFRKGDTALAAKWKQGQVLQSALQDEANGVREEVRQALRQFQNIATAKDEGNRDAALANMARAILQQYGLAKADKTAADYLEQVHRYDPDLHADLVALTEGMPAPVADFKQLTTADFREVRDRVQAIWTLARSTREIEIDGKKMELEQAAASLAEQLAFEPAAKREQMVGHNDRLDLRFRLAGVRAALRRVEFWADARDRGDKSGPFRRYVWQPVSEAVTRYRTQRNLYVGKFLQLLKPIEATLTPGKIAAPELADGMVFADRSALLHALLHTGNESNKRKLLLGYRWAEERADGTLDTSRWDAFLARMHNEGRITKADWQFVQGVWDLLDDMKPAAQAAHHRMFGTYFAEITADSVQTPFGELRGGYVPAVTDSLLVPEARQHGAMDDMLAGQNSPMFPAVTRGFTKSRVDDYTRPLALDLRMLPAHIDKVSRFSVLGPVLRDTARLVLRNRTFKQAMTAVDPTAAESMLMPWLKRVAAQTLTKPPESQADRAVARIANTVRNRTGLLLMAGNVVNTLQQFTGWSIAALRVPPRHLAGALVDLVRSPVATGKAINELSPWMQQRSDDSARDVERTIDRLLTNPNALQRAEQFGNRYGYALQQAAQNVIDRVVWLGAYRQAQRTGVDGAEAVRAADSAVRMTQGSFAPEDAAKVEHAGAFTRLFLQFASYFNAQANLLATEVHNARGRPLRLALVYLLGFAVPAFLADLISKAMRGELDDEDGDELADKVLQSFFVSQARYALAMVPVAGQAGNAAIGQFTPDRFDDRIGASPAYSAAEATVRAPVSIYKAVAEDGNPKAAVRDGLTALELLTGLPVGPLVRPLGYLADDKRDDEIKALGLVTGKQ